jgi:hypothetical protein
MDLVAKTEIHRTVKPGKAATTEGGRGTKPVVEVIKPLEPFVATKEEGEEFVAMGAAVKAPDGTKMPKTNTQTSEKAAAAQQAAQGSGEGSGESKVKAVSAMTVAELTDELDEREVEYPADAKKADLVAALTTARDAADMV